MAQRVHSKIIEKIHELVLEGVIDPLEVQCHLKHYVRHSLCGEQPPDVLDRAYYPELQDIRNHINKAKRGIQLSVLDQENVALKVEQWKKESPTANYLFRPFNKSSSESNAEVPEQSLLWVHQEVWQQDLLFRYGNTITMIDATYKTTKYDLPLFFVCVKTNHGYCVAAEFISQNECATAIQEPLEVLKTWNPQWQPEFLCVTTARQRLLPLKHHSQALLYTFVIFTENRLGKDGSRTTNMVSPLQMQMFSLIFFEHVRGLHLQLPMRMA